MQHLSRRFTVLVVLAVVGGGVALQSARSSAASGGSAASATDATATVSDDGTVAVTGITLPGGSVELPAACADAESQTAKVVCAADTFLATLSDEQQAEVVLPATRANAIVWSNLPTSFVPRNGIELGTLSDAQRAAALAVVKAATGSPTDDGYSEVTQLLMADDVLAASGGMQNGAFGSGGMPSGGMPPGGMRSSGGFDGGPPSGGMGPGSGGASGFTGGTGSDYSSGLYYLAFLGTPNTTDTWILQFGGHHLAINTTYKAGKVASATPEFRGVEPLVWTTEDATYAPLSNEQEGMAAMLASLNDEQLSTAKLSETFSDVLVGPGQDGQFPETKVGIAVSELSDEQQALVLAAMTPWVQDADDTTAAELLAIYGDELAETYVAFSGDPSLTNNADYVRIDGPSVWIEFVCQSGIVYSDQIHYHTVWRDHERDYGAEYNF